MKCPLGTLEDVLVKVSNFYVLNDFGVLNMAEDAYTQIILGRLFLASAGCKIDVRGRQLIIDMGDHHEKFGLLKD